MAKPYSYNLRAKVINAIELDGLPKSEASTRFTISRNTIHQWLNRKAQTGDFQAQPNCPPGHSHKITDWDKFREFVQIHGDKTQAQMAQLWDAELSSRTLSRALRKIGYTRKKRPMVTENAMMPSGLSI